MLGSNFNRFEDLTVRRRRCTYCLNRSLGAERTERDVRIKRGGRRGPEKDGEKTDMGVIEGMKMVVLNKEALRHAITNFLFIPIFLGSYSFIPVAENIRVTFAS